MKQSGTTEHFDVIIIGAGIMGSTAAGLLATLEPGWRIGVLEALDAVGLESSHGWNNAGTGHAGLCEFNYTSAAADGSIDPTDALRIHEQFLVSTQYWAHLVQQGRIDAPADFIRSVPHCSFARGKWTEFLRIRHAALSAHPLFASMEFTDDPATMRRWLPLMLRGRRPIEDIAATRSALGTDVDYGSLTSKLMSDASAAGVEVALGTRVRGIARDPKTGHWSIRARNAQGDRVLEAKFVFVAAGGGTLPLLQSARMPEVKTMGGFPISGLFLRTSNKELIEQHRAKVYGHPSDGAPAISVPHLDLRVLDGREYLMFGPFGAFSPRFLKRGKLRDLAASVTPGNLGTLLSAARTSADLVRYLVSQILTTPTQRLDALRAFVPNARTEDWELVRAGQRVQVIKHVDGAGAIAGFGTEVVLNDDRSLAALLGASPGASASVGVVLDLLKRSFPERYPEWLSALRKDMPHLGTELNTDAAALARVREQVGTHLSLDW